MDKETVLKLSREENDGQDEMERGAIISGNNIAYLVGGIVCVIILLLQLIFGKEPNFSVYAVFFSMTATSQLMKYRKTKKTVVFVSFILNGFTAAVFFALYVRGLFR
ncbi:MAG: hypothetical protein IJK98_01945 [Clostridia bacterium]|nr:hypothetical protein [Clostridia bacterium]